ncbi:MAG: hypothetical protein KC550_01345 [Nanoarchaeota archaeon]|nr:hypothetical protein [Nanoarchaeota archaeon]
MDFDEQIRYELNDLNIMQRVLFKGLVGDTGEKIGFGNSKYLKLDEVAKLVLPNNCGFNELDLKPETVISDVRIYGGEYANCANSSLREVARIVQNMYPETFLVGRRIGLNLERSFFNGKLYVVRNPQNFFLDDTIKSAREMWV